MTNFKANYNGEVIKAGEVMVAFPYSEVEDENCFNRECIKTLTQGGRKFKVIYKAVPEEWAKDAKNDLNWVQNDRLGHYAVPNSVSMNMTQDEYELDLGSIASVEQILEEREEFNEAVRMFAEKMQEMIVKTPKLGYAVILLYSGIKGEEFYEKMLLSRGPANRILQQAKTILFDGLLNYDFSITSYKSPNDEIYRVEALRLLADIVAEF